MEGPAKVKYSGERWWEDYGDAGVFMRKKWSVIGGDILTRYCRHRMKREGGGEGSKGGSFFFLLGVGGYAVSIDM